MLQAIETKYAGRVLSDDDFELEIEFQEPQNSISLDIQKHGQVLESGWKITPMTHPGVSWSCILAPCVYSTYMIVICIQLKWYISTVETYQVLTPLFMLKFLHWDEKECIWAHHHRSLEQQHLAKPVG